MIRLQVSSVLFGALALLAAPERGPAQLAAPGADTLAPAPSRGEAVGEARAAQARYELRRVRHFPRARAGSHGPCDETIGRFCTWFDEGEWAPEPEPPEVTAMRAELLGVLDSLQAHAPANAWLLGQRVWYRHESGDVDGALRVARSCEPPQEDWWCAALTGFGLHVTGRYDEAERAFDRALYAMDLERAWRWRVPTRAVDGDLRGTLEALREAEPDSVERVLARMWTFADPLLLVDGNDRRTEHFARWTAAEMRDGSRNPYRLSWGADLEELLVRHGWELGWERERDPRFMGTDGIVGHKHPEGRDYLPPGAVLLAPAASRPEDLVAGHRRPSSLYAPRYAPVLLPLAGQVARFPRGRTVTVVATHALPADTTRHASHDHARPWMEPGDQAHLPDLAGIFLVDLEGGEVRARTREGRTEGAFMVEAPAGVHLLSVEAWSPPARRAGRHREIVAYEPAPVDLPVLSDLLLLEGGGEPPDDLEAAAPRSLPARVAPSGSSFALAWEVTGLGFRPETLSYALSVERVDRSLLQRIGGFFGLSNRPRPLALAWEEEGPSEPGAPAFHHLDIELPELDRGVYRVRLVLRTAARDPVESTLDIEVP